MHLFHRIKGMTYIYMTYIYLIYKDMIGLVHENHDKMAKCYASPTIFSVVLTMQIL